MDGRLNRPLRGRNSFRLDMLMLVVSLLTIAWIIVSR
jgi:hypothetical protein